MSARVGASNLEEAVKELARHWEQTRQSWRDTKAQEFQRLYLDRLPHIIANARNLMEQTDVILRKVRTDCE